MPSDEELTPPHRPFPQWNKKMRRTAIATPRPQFDVADSPQYADALKFVEKVKARFEGQPNDFGEFFSIVRRFRDGDLPPMEACIKMAKLFRNHLDLYANFKLFLPAAFEPPEMPEEKNPLPQYADAMKFVEKVKARFGAQSNATGEFLGILKRFWEGNVSPAVVCTKMAALFRDHQGLHEDFKFFLPPFGPPALPDARREEEAGPSDTNPDRAN